MAALVYDASLDDDPEMVEAVRAAAAIALENERLLAESEARLAEVQASRQRIVAAGDAERRRLERDLHDGAQQRLVALVAAAADDPAPTSAATPRQAEQLVDRGERRARAVARRSCASSRAASIRRRSTTASPPALESLAARSTVPTAVSCDAPRARAASRSSSPLYFVACEALANVGKYAEATAASVRLSRTAAGVAIEIADDGVGGADAARGSGLHGLADRVEALDGHLRVTSPPGAGTVVTAELPCAS